MRTTTSTMTMMMTAMTKSRGYPIIATSDSRNRLHLRRTLAYKSDEDEVSEPDDDDVEEDDENDDEDDGRTNDLNSNDTFEQ